MIVFFLSSVKAYSQLEVRRYPVQFSQYVHSLTLFNPATAGLYSRIELNAGNQSLTGNFSRVSTYYTNFNMRFPIQKNHYHPFSTGGITMINDMEGRYLNRLRLYAIYAWHTQLTRRVNFAGGLQLGGMNFVVKGTPSTGNGSDLAPDASVGILFYTDKWKTGFSAGQLVNSKLQPLDEITILSPFYNLHLSAKVFSNEPVVLEPMFLARMTHFSNEINFDINLHAEIFDRIMANVGYRYHLGAVFMAGIKNLEVQEGIFNLLISYQFPFQKTELNLNTIEMSLCFFLKK